MFECEAFLSDLMPVQRFCIVFEKQNSRRQNYGPSLWSSDVYACELFRTDQEHTWV
jgi:hypothetical protein